MMGLCSTQHPLPHSLYQRRPALPAISGSSLAVGLRRLQVATRCAAKKGREPAVVKEAPDVAAGGRAGSAPPPEAPLRVSLSQPPAPSSSSSSGGSQDSGGGGGGGDAMLGAKVAWRRVLKELSSLPRAIAIMFTIAGLSGLGTIIPQNKAFSYYIENYPDTPGRKVLGFLDYNLMFLLQLDHIYTAWYFYLSLGLLAASLTACTWTRQWPAVKVAQRWRFLKTPEGVVKLGNAEVLPNARLPDLGSILGRQGYQVFLQDQSLYAFKGLAGRIGPIGVHAALLLVLGGTSYSGLGGFKGSVICPEGGDFVPAQFMRPASAISSLPASASATVHVDDFSIDYRPNGAVAQFYSTLSVIDDQGQAMLTKKISVNDPLRYNGITMYQTDWALAAVTLHVDVPSAQQQQQQQRRQLQTSPSAPELADPSSSASASPPPSSSPSSSSSSPSLPAPNVPSFNGGAPFNLPLASLEGRPGVSGRLWASFLPLSAPGADGAAPKGISVLARDPQSVVLYDSQGKFVGVRRPGSGKPIEVEGLRLVVDDVVGSTGLEIKNDPGVPWVYAGFGGLMITTLVSYLSHSQVWAVQRDGYVYVSGRSNRAVISFEKELDEMLEMVPERLPASGSGSSSSSNGNGSGSSNNGSASASNGNGNGAAAPAAAAVQVSEGH